MTAFLLKGPKIIIRIALLIIDHMKNQILKADDFMQLNQVFSEDIKNEITPQILAKYLKQKKYKLRRR